MAKKELKPDYKIMKGSAVAAMQYDYECFVKHIHAYYSNVFIDNDGNVRRTYDAAIEQKRANECLENLRRHQVMLEQILCEMGAEDNDTE